MHELSIAVSLVDAALERAVTLPGERVRALHLRLGPLSGVVREALSFSFEIAAADTAIAGATLVIDDVPLVAWCPQCATERELPSVQFLCCPVCGTPTAKVISGRELELFALEMDEVGAIESEAATDVATNR
jgi:hydrogenase nickel incorporation protein HypA/HybF